MVDLVGVAFPRQLGVGSQAFPGTGIRHHLVVGSVKGFSFFLFYLFIYLFIFLFFYFLVLDRTNEIGTIKIRIAEKGEGKTSKVRGLGSEIDTRIAQRVQPAIPYTISAPD